MKKDEYLAGEIADIFGIAIANVRYYHKIGLLSPARKEGNNYRYFNQSSVSNVHSVTLLRSLGMPIEKIQAFFDTEDLNILSEQMTENLDEVQKEIHRLCRQQVELKRFQKQLGDVHQYLSAITIRQSPRWRTICESTERDLAEMNRSFRRLMDSVEYLPSYAYLMSAESFQARRFDYYRYCLLLDPECDHVPDGTGIIPSRKCAYYVFNGKEEQLPEIYGRIYQWIQKNDYQVIGDIVERFILSTPRTSIMELWIPVGEET